MTNQPQDIAQGVAGAAVTASSAVVTYLDVANQFVDLGAGVVAIVAGLMTCVWTYHRIKEMRRKWDK